MVTLRDSSMTVDELYEASPCNWCLIREVCFEYCDAKMDWLRIFHGQDTFRELRELMAIFPTSTTSTTTMSYGIRRKDSVKNERHESNSRICLPRLPCASELFRTLPRTSIIKIKEFFGGKWKKITNR